MNTMNPDQIDMHMSVSNFNQKVSNDNLTPTKPKVIATKRDLGSIEESKDIEVSAKSIEKVRRLSCSTVTSVGHDKKSQLVSVS